MEITLRQIESFVTVADLGSMTKAAELLHLSQPALSRQIASLERSLGSVLFDRRPRPVLTPHGRALLAKARAVLDAVADLEQRRTEIEGDEVGELRVGVIHSLIVTVLPSVLREWTAAHPGVELRLEEFSHGNELAASVHDGALDLALGPRPLGWAGSVVPLFVERFVVTMSTNHPLASSRASLDLGETTDHPWIHYHPTHGLAEVLDRACEHAGFAPKVSVRVRQTVAAPLLAESSGALALVPDNAVPVDFAGVARPVRPKLERPIVAYAGRTLDPLAQHLVSMIRRQRTATGRLRDPASTTRSKNPC